MDVFEGFGEFKLNSDGIDTTNHLGRPQILTPTSFAPPST